MKRISFKFILVIAMVVVMAAGSGGLPARAQVNSASGALPRRLPVAIGHAEDMGLRQNQGIPTPEDPAEAGWKWYALRGPAFHPTTSSITWTDPGGACLYALSPGEWYANLNLPDGSIMKKLVIGFYNYSGSTTSDVSLYSYNADTTSFEAGYVVSVPASSGLGPLETEGLISPPYATVNNDLHSYMFKWSGSTNQLLCYVKVAYESPSIFGMALPVIRKGP